VSFALCPAVFADLTLARPSKAMSLASASRRASSGRWRRSAPVEAQEVEGDEGGPRLAALGQERVEVAAPVVPEQIFARAVASG